MNSLTLPSLPIFDLPSPEELNRRARARHAAAMASVSQSGRFISTSLQAWVAHAEAAGIPHITAQPIGSLKRDTVLRCDEPTAGDIEDLAWLQSAISSVPSSHMVRWDPCAPFGIKHGMSYLGDVEPDDKRHLSLDDPRAFNIIYEYPSDTVSVLARPWVDALRIESYPVEFRAFTQNSQLLGVGSYYPQRPLPDTPEIRKFVQRCEDLSLDLVNHLDATGQYPWMPSFDSCPTVDFKPNTVSATLDFLVDQQGQVLFLEAGPPWGAGAHPVSFLDREVKGVSLALAEGVKLR